MLGNTGAQEPHPVWGDKDLNARGAVCIPGAKRISFPCLPLSIVGQVCSQTGSSAKGVDTGGWDKRADSPPRRARRWRKTKLYRTKKRQRCQLNHTDLKGVKDAQGRKASITCKPIKWACCRLACTCHRTIANYVSSHQEAEDSCRTECRTPSCSEMLVNTGAQACAGQPQDTVTGPPDAKLMEPNHAMLQAILEGTQITGTTVYGHDLTSNLREFV